LLLKRNDLEARRGITVRAINSDARIAQATVSANSQKSWPAKPLRNTTGKKTLIVVSVEAVIAPATSCAPSIAASAGFLPAW